MSQRKYIKTKYRGVFYRTSLKRKCGDGSPDRCYVVWYQDGAGKAHWHTVGWHSEGIRAVFANQVRADLTKDVTAGKNPAVQRTYTVGVAVESFAKVATTDGRDISREIKRYDKHLKAALDAVPVSSIHPDRLNEIKSELLGKLSPASVRLAFAHVRCCINNAIATGAWKGINPFSTTRTSPFRMPRVDNASLRYLTPQEVKVLLPALRKRSRQLHDMALLSLKTGLRACEVFSITAQDVNPETGFIHFRAKGGKRQQVHCDLDVIDMLLGYGRQPGEYIFQARVVGGPITRGISTVFSKVVDELDLNKGITDPRYKVIFHTLRHTFASWLAQSGKVTLHELKELMRHERIEMTLRYAHLIPGRQKGQLAIISDILNQDGHD